MRWRSAFATTAGVLQGGAATPDVGSGPARAKRAGPDRALDLRVGDEQADGDRSLGGTADDRAVSRVNGAATVRTLHYPAGDVLVVSGLPGSGKSTLIRQTVAPLTAVRRVDSQDVRERYERRMPGWLPYAVYRPVVRMVHYYGLVRAVRSGASLVVHDCGSIASVRAFLARAARRRGRGMHLLLLDVSPNVAAEGQQARGRRVSTYAFARHRRASGRLIRAAERATARVSPAGAVRSARASRSRLPRGCVSAVLLDRPAARALREIRFGD